MPRPRPSRCTYTESSTVGAYAGRGRNGEREAKPSTRSASSTATIAGWPPECSASQTFCSSIDLGTRSKVTVVSATSRL